MRDQHLADRIAGDVTQSVHAQKIYESLGICHTHIQRQGSLPRKQLCDNDLRFGARLQTGTQVDRHRRGTHSATRAEYADYVSALQIFEGTCDGFLVVNTCEQSLDPSLQLGGVGW